MIEKILNLFFEKRKKVNCITVIKNRNVCEDAYAIVDILTRKKQVKTCLSKYFENRKGLNVSEREKFYNAIFSARNQR